MRVWLVASNLVLCVCRVAQRVHLDGKPALTDFHVLAAAPATDLSAGQPAVWAAPALRAGANGTSLISCKPHTGRTHQIRVRRGAWSIPSVGLLDVVVVTVLIHVQVHLAHAGHAIIGDDLYGLTGPWLGRQALHAASITLLHPRTQCLITVRAPLPEDIAKACQQLGLR